MSSTNRSKARENHVSDYYVTPIESIVNFLTAFEKDEQIFKYNFVLDPCAGGDKEHKMSYPEALKRKGYIINLATIDIRSDSKANSVEDYLKADCKGRYQVIITNPPFNKALEIIEKALSDVQDKGYVIMLLRLNFFGSKARKIFFDKHMPKYAYVHNRRMKFRNTGGTDSIEYMHAVWQKGYYPIFTKLRVI